MRARQALPAAHRRPGLARACSPPSPAPGCPARRRRETDGPPLPQVTSRSSRSATGSLTATRTVTLEDIEHFAQLHRRHLLRPHGRGRRQGEPVLRRPRRPRLPRRLASPPACSSTPTPARCSPTTASTPCASSPRSIPATRCRWRSTCKQKTARETENYGEVRWDCTVTNQDGKVCAQYDVLTLVEKATN